MRYWLFAKRGFEHIKHYPVLLLPETMLFIATYFLTLGLYWFSGLAEFTSASLISGQKVDFAVFLTSFARDYATQIIVSLAVFIFVTFVLGAGTEAVKFRMIKNVVLGGKAAARDIFAGGASDFGRIIAMKIIIYLIALAIALMLALLASFLFSISNGLLAFAAWISIGIGIAVFVIMSIGLLFRYAILFLDEKNAATTVRYSFHYFTRNTRHVLNSWLVYFGMAVLFGIAGALLSMAFAQLQEAVTDVTMVYLAGFAGAIIVFAVRLVYNVWAGLFLFESYRKSRKL